MLSRNKPFLFTLLSAHMSSVLILVWFNNFALTMGFCWSHKLMASTDARMQMHTSYCGHNLTLIIWNKLGLTIMRKNFMGL